MKASTTTKMTGLILVAFGLWAVAVGMNVVHIAPSKDVPRWMVGVAGFAFAFAGLAVLLRNDYVLRRARPPSKTIVFVQWICATAPSALLAWACTWVSLGPGTRHFKSRGLLTFMSQTPRAAETNGRIGFGVAAVLLALMTVTTFVAGLRRFQGVAASDLR